LDIMFYNYFRSTANIIKRESGSEPFLEKDLFSAIITSKICLFFRSKRFALNLML